jgi:hypothetical protein
MAKMFLSLALVSVLVSQTAMAEVPTQALTFDTNVTIENATSDMEAKIRTAEELIKRVIATEQFRTRVIGYTYNGVRKYVDNDGFTNEQIYQKILDGAETLNKITDNQMDLQIEMYYAATSTVGYTYSSSPKIYANTKFYNGYSPATITGNMTHEWLHKLGFGHASSYSISRDSSVPYAIGFIMRDIAATIKLDDPSPDFFTAAANLTVTNTTSNVTLKWSAATSSNGIESYKVYRKLSGSTSTYLQGTTTSLSYTQTRPTTNATYYVKATDKAGKTLNSATVEFVRLTAPTSVTITKTTTTATVKWAAAQSSAGVKEYRVYRKLYGSSTYYLQSTTTSLSYSQTRPSSTAYYYVKSVDVNGETKSSSTVTLSKY